MQRALPFTTYIQIVFVCLALRLFSHVIKESCKNFYRRNTYVMLVSCYVRNLKKHQPMMLAARWAIWATRYSIKTPTPRQTKHVSDGVSLLLPLCL